jgi:hypothetical protein
MSYVSTETRTGRGFKWRSRYTDSFGNVLSEIKGYTIDNLDTKDISDASNVFEEIFIQIRKELEKCNAISAESLNACHQVARRLSKGYKKIED